MLLLYAFDTSYGGYTEKKDINIDFFDKIAPAVSNLNQKFAQYCFPYFVRKKNSKK